MERASVDNESVTLLFAQPFGQMFNPVFLFIKVPLSTSHFFRSSNLHC